MRSEGQLRLIQKALGIGIWSMDIANNTMMWSAEQFVLFGIDPEAGPPTYPEWLELVAPEHRDMFAEAEERLKRRTHDVLKLEFRLKDGPSGSGRWLICLGCMVTDDDGSPVSFVGVNVDITDKKQAEEQYRQAAALVSAIGACSPDAIFAKDTQGRMVYANPAMASGVGRTLDQLLGRTDSDWHDDAEQAAGFMRDDLRIIDSGRAEVTFDTFNVPGRPPLRIRTAKAPLRSESGETIGVVGISSDMTPILQAQQSLEDSEHRFRAFFEQSAVGMSQIGLDGRPIQVNDRLCDMLGYSRAELLALSFRDITHPDDIPSNEAHLARLKSGEASTFTLEKRYRRKDGGVVWAEMTASLVRDGSGAPLYYASVIVDISSRKSAQAEMLSSDERFRASFEQSAVGLAHVRLDGSLLLVNDRFCELFGYDRVEALAITFRDVSFPEDIPTSEAFLSDLVNGGAEIVRADKRYIRKDGTFFWATMTLSAVRGASGLPSYCVLVVEDISDRKAAEMALRESEERFRASFDQSAVGMAHVAMDGAWLRVNDRLCAMLGGTREELLERRVIDIIHPDDSIGDEAESARLVTGEIDCFTSDGRFLRLDGSCLWGMLTVSIVRRKDGSPDYFAAVVEDISQRRMAEIAATESEGHLRVAFEQSAVGMAHVSPDSRNLRVNDRLCELLGYDREELMGIVIRDLTHPDDMERSEYYGKRLLDGELATYTIDKRYIRKDGSVVWLLVTISAVLEANGLLAYYYCVFDDISDRKAAEQALQESEERFRAAFEQSAVGMAHLEMGGRLIRVNDRLCELLGYERRELLGKTFQELTHPDDYASSMAHYPGLVGGDIQSFTIDKRYIRKDGSIAWVMLTATVMYDRDGSPLYFSSVFEDITQRKAAELALQESEERARRLFEGAPLPNYLVDLSSGAIVDCNEAATIELGYSREELTRLTLADVDPTVEGTQETPRLVMETGASVQVEAQHRTRTGEIRDVMLAIVPVEIGGRRLAHGTAVDITERKRMDADLRRLTADLEARVREEVSARESAQFRAAQAERMQALGQLAGGIAHDFNNVLQAVQGSASLIGRLAGESDEIRKFARIIMDASDRGASITRRLLAFGRRGNLHAEPIDASAVLDGMRDILGSILGAAIEIKVDVSSSTPQLMADKGQLQTALVNLATNARDAMPQGGTLTFAASVEVVRNPDSEHPVDLVPGNYVRISVSDDGIGMDKATLRHVGEPFFTTKPPGSGTGLGVAMVQGFAEQSGGGVLIDSALGTGTTVSIWIPQAGTPAGSCVRDGTLRDDPARLGSRVRGRGRLLVVDDDPLVLSTLVAELRDEGFDVVTAENGTQALELLLDGMLVDALVSDLSMPGMDGVCLIEAAQQREPNLPAILLTGFAGEGVAAAVGSRVKGPFRLMRKPSPAPDVAAQIMAFLAGKDAIH